MTWDLVGSWTITDYKTLLPLDFNSHLAIKVTAVSDLKPTWNYAGFFYQYVDIPALGLSRIEEKIAISIRDPIILIPKNLLLPYQLKFQKADWIDSLILTIYQDSMPIYNAQDTVIFPNTKTSSSVATTVAPATTSTSVLAANPNRKKVIIANNTNQVMILELGATASAATSTITLAAKTAGGLVSIFESDNYTGVISAIAPAAASGAWNVREFT